MELIQLDSELARRLDEGMRSGEAIELPFSVIYLWALNGQASYKTQGGTLYYGGWAVKTADLQALTDQAGLPIPADWKQVTIATRDGGEIDAYTVRYLFIAPIGKRISWLFDGKRYPEYVEGGRRHLQALVYLFEKQGKNGEAKYVPWGPVVLTAKGYQARNVLDAFSKWNKATAALRAKVAPGVPANCFIFSIGTFGNERKSVNVGQPGTQSPITPLSAWIPENLSEAVIRGLFVGDTAVQMVEYQSQAAEWLGAWKDQAVESQPAEGDAEYINGMPENWQQEDSEIPF